MRLLPRSLLGRVFARRADLADAELWERRPDMAGLPVTCHAALLARARRLLSAAGFRVVIAWA